MKSSTLWLKNLAQEIKPKLYVEIGINQAQTFNVIPCDFAIGIDPNPDCKHCIKRKKYEFYCGTSDHFMIDKGNDIQGTVDLVFVDGLHTAEQAILDFYYALRLIGNDGWIVLHDTWPPDSRHREPDRCGDVYKITTDIRDVLRNAPDYELLTLPWAYGLTIIRKGPSTNEEI